jgi:hypothetical protein
MKPWLAILLTLGLLVMFTAIVEITHVNLVFPMVIGTSLWVAIDSRKLQLRRYKSGLSYGPVVLFIACVGLWIVGFPWYLIVRHQIKTGVAVLKEQPVAEPG